MERDEHLAQLASDGQRIADLANGDLTSPVPTCPGWTLGDLVEHTGRVHRWMIAAVRAPAARSPEEAKEESPAEGETWQEWFRRGVDEAIRTMSSLTGREARWTWFPPDQTAGWYFRRIAHETLIHRIDAELAAAVPIQDTSPTVAADGLDEMCDVFLPAATGQAIAGDGRTLRLQPTDADERWILTLHADRVDTSRHDADADATLRGSALDLLLMAWGRLPLGAVEHVGDAQVIETFNAAAKI